MDGGGRGRCIATKTFIAVVERRFNVYCSGSANEAFEVCQIESPRGGRMFSFAKGMSRGSSC
jgi:hypothetical protein